MEMKISVGLSPNGCFAQAAGRFVLFASLPARGTDYSLPIMAVEGMGLTRVSWLVESPHLDEDGVKLAAIINQMPALGRKQIMQQQPLNVKETLGATAERLGRLPNAPVSLRLEIAPVLPPVLADSEMFQQIVFDLVVHARDALGSGGQLALQVGAVTFDGPAQPGRRPGSFVRLRLAGVASGTGSGLDAVREMLRQNQGWLELESRPGEGALFDIYFPVAVPSPAKAGGEPVAGQVRSRKETVLVVEDEDVLREMVREILESQGYEVLDAANSFQALDVWDQNRDNISLLLTDNVLPEGLSGRELAVKLRGEAPRLPVIVSSGHTQETMEEGPGGAADFAFLCKPYRPMQLLQAVRHALDGGAPSGPPPGGSGRPS
jgi:two-component system, cell cycle sensor histidine kinase and response regulator CckA